MFVDIVKMFIL